jgi:methylmalonyl-CoA mutase
LVPSEVIRSTEEERNAAIAHRDAFQRIHHRAGDAAISDLKRIALGNGNLFESLMEATKVCTLGQLSTALYEVGGQYRRNM